MNLRGAVAVVTGGNGGLGQCICRKLAEQGVNVAVVYAKSAGDAEAVAADLRETGEVSAQSFKCDVTQPDEVEAMVESVVSKFGRLDILVNDAAYNKAIAFPDLDGMTHTEWSKIIDVNLTGPMHCIKAVAPVMERQGRGRIINIASVAGLAPTGSSIAYAVSKAGLIHLTRCMAVALAPHTLVNCVAPGLIEGTRATANLTADHIRRASEAAVLKIPAEKDDCADQVVAMCRTNTMTGQTVVVDAGRVFH